MKGNIVIWVVGIVSCLLFVPPGFSFTVILKSGKRVEGTWLGEDQSTLQIKDQHGVILTFKKGTLDFRAMSAVSRRSSSASSPEGEGKQVSPNLTQTQLEQAKQDEPAGVHGPSSGDLPSAKPPAAPSLPSKKGRLWSLDTSVSNVYDSNINHDPEELRSVGLIYGAEASFRNRTDKPSFEVTYEIARHSYSQTDKWDRISHDLLAAYERRLAKHFSFEMHSEINLKGSSEDRELSNQYILEPHLNYRLTKQTRFDFYGAHRLKRYSDDPGKNSINRYGGVDFLHLIGRQQLGVGFRYERNNADVDRNSYIRWTYGGSYAISFSKRNQFSCDLRYRPQTYEHRLIDTADNEKALRHDERWIFTLETTIALSEHLYLLPGYRFETRSSNDPDKEFTEHLPSLTLQYRW